MCKLYFVVILQYFIYFDHDLDQSSGLTDRFTLVYIAGRLQRMNAQKKHHCTFRIKAFKVYCGFKCQQ